jgi:phosphopantothenoylcysteine decarboxylase / phosphopantothenate---cysteine ligase
MSIPERKKYTRNPRAIVAASNTGVVLVSPDGSSICIRSKPSRICALMELLREPCDQETIERHLHIGFSEIEKLVAVLEKRQIILSDTEEKLADAIPKRPKAAKRPCKRVVIGICGGVQAAMLIPLLIVVQRILAEQIEIILTEAAEHFVSPQTLSYFGFRVWDDMYACNDRVDNETGEKINVPHIYLASSADLVLIIPATASTIHRLASGACSDLLSLIVSATRAPVIVAPTMNTAMLQYAPVRRNLDELRSCGMYVVEPGLGFEVSTGSDDQLRFSGIGLTEGNIVHGVAAILAAHQQLHEPIQSNGAATAASPETAKSALN